MVIVNDINDEKLLDDIFEQELIVYEDVKGTTIYARYDGEDFIIKPDMNSDPINILDDSIETYYGRAFSYLNNLSDRVKSLLNKRWWFVFEYMEERANKYARKPKHNLILSAIIKVNKFEYTVEELEEYARLMETESLPIIFMGKLSSKSIEAIKYFLNTSESDLEYVFGESNFAYFFYKILNPQLAQSFLMDNEFSINVEKIIIKIQNTETSFAILNPLYNRISSNNYTEYSEIFSLILVNFLNYCQTINLDTLKLKGEKRDEIYTYMMCKLYNMYIENVKEDIHKFNFVVPEFFNSFKFRINKEIVINKVTKQLLNESPKLEYVFKCIYFSFRYEMKEPIGILNKNMLKIFNNYIKELNAKIDDYLNKQNEIELGKKGLVAFSDFIDISYDKDGNDQVYPDVYDEIMKGEDKKKKKFGYDKSDISNLGKK